MPHLRNLGAGLLLFLALAAWGCSSADDDEGQPAAAQPAAAKQLSTSNFRVDSPNFQEKTRPRLRIPKENTCFGDNVSPPLDWTEAPPDTKSLALIVEDVDHHTGVWVHWVLYNIPSDVAGLPGAISTGTDALPDGTTQGINDDKNVGYTGPCPPPVIKAYDAYDYSAKPGSPPHRYYFRLYALDTELSLAPGATRSELESAMEGHMLGQADTMGKYTAPVKLELHEE